LLYRGRAPASRLGLGFISSNPRGARCSELGSPTGDGEAMSHSAPLQGWSSSSILQKAAVVKPCTPHVLHHNTLLCHAPATSSCTLHPTPAPSSCTLHAHPTPIAGDGELRIPPEPVGRPHLGSGAKPQCPGCRRTRVVVYYDSATRTVSFRCRCGWRKLFFLTCRGLQVGFVAGGVSND